MANTDVTSNVLDDEARTFDLPFARLSPADGVMPLVAYAHRAFSMKAIAAKLTAGTGTLQIRINNVAVDWNDGSGAEDELAIDANESAQPQQWNIDSDSAGLNGVVPAGARVTAHVSASSSDIDLLEASIKCVFAR